jgi:hypothetical protein
LILQAFGLVLYYEKMVERGKNMGKGSMIPIEILLPRDYNIEKVKQKFNKAPSRAYDNGGPPLAREFKFAEQWYVESGKAEFIDKSNGRKMTATTGEIIKLPKNSAFFGMRYSVDFKVKQYLDDKTEREKRSTNIKINYLIIQTILEITDLFEDFTSPVPHDTGWLFKCARQGDLYQYIDSWKMVDDVIQNLVERTGILENVWYGKRRIKTGLKFEQPNWDKTNSIDYIDLYDPNIKNEDSLYKDIMEDPLDLRTYFDFKEDKNFDYVELVHTLKQIFIFIARNIKEEEKDIFSNIFPSDIKLSQPRNSGKYLDSRGMPRYIIYGSELAEAMRRLFWSTSIGY